MEYPHRLLIVFVERKQKKVAEIHCISNVIVYEKVLKWLRLLVH